MRQAVYKYNLKQLHRQLVMIPKGAQFLSVGVQGNDDVCVWYLVDIDAEKVSVDFEIEPTGSVVDELNRTSARVYRGTCLLWSGTYILHVFEILPQ